jgi:uncharacterized membrane protein
VNQVRVFRELSSESGSILPLIMGGCALALAITLGVTTATSLYVERKRLLALADGAALAAAQSFDIGLPPRASSAGILLPQLSNRSVAAGASTFVAGVPVVSLHRAHIAEASTADGRTAHIRVQTTWRPPFVSFFFAWEISLEAESSARAVR